MILINACEFTFEISAYTSANSPDLYNIFKTFSISEYLIMSLLLIKLNTVVSMFRMPDKVIKGLITKLLKYFEE